MYSTTGQVWSIARLPSSTSFIIAARITSSIIGIIIIISSSNINASTAVNVESTLSTFRAVINGRRFAIIPGTRIHRASFLSLSLSRSLRRRRREKNHFSTIRPLRFPLVFSRCPRTARRRPASPVEHDMIP